MATKFDLDGKDEGAWFDLDGGGRIQLRTLSIGTLKDIRKQCVKQVVEYKRIEGKAERFEVEKENADLSNELFWDHCIVAWEKFVDGKGKEIPCTKENKILLMTQSQKFVRFVSDCLKKLTEDEEAKGQALEKNS
jgi:hypothetical protein